MRRLLSTLVLLVVSQCWAPQLRADVASFRVVNSSGRPQPERIVTFGQMFRPGDVRPTSQLSVTLGGAAAAAQMDAKALYPDGSVRHAVLSVRTPAMASGASLNGRIGTAAAAPVSPPLASQPPPNVVVTLTFSGGAGPGKVVTIALPALARSAAARSSQPWLKGPLAREQRFASQTTDGVEIDFDVWTPAVGPSRVDVIFHNDWAQNAQIATQIYDADISLNGASVFSVKHLVHYTYATWRHLVWTGGPAPPRVVPDMRLLEEVGAIPHYNLAIRPDPAAMDKLVRTSLRSVEPLGYGAVTPYMPTTGGRPDIGPLPTWAVFYVLDPSAENEAALMANADVSGSAPWHVRDMTTGEPISIDAHPDVWFDGRGQATPGILNRKFYTLDTKWQVDDAHEPSLTYLPYLLTGSQYYRDELTQQAAYNLLAINPPYRGGSRGIVLGSQVRGVAWDLRTLANAAYILPSNDPMQPYLQAKLGANLHAILDRYVNGHEADAAGELEGYLPGPYGVDGATAPWQDDYVVMVLGWIDSMGYHDARPIMSWMTNFVAGLFTNGDRGYDPIYGTPYFLYVDRPHTTQPLSTWAEAFNTTFDPARHPVTTLDDPAWGGGYAALARGALASIINSTHAPQARQAYDFVVAHTPEMNADYAKEPTFAITPVSAPHGS